MRRKQASRRYGRRGPLSLQSAVRPSVSQPSCCCTPTTGPSEQTRHPASSEPWLSTPLHAGRPSGGRIGQRATHSTGGAETQLAPAPRPIGTSLQPAPRGATRLRGGAATTSATVGARRPLSIAPMRPRERRASVPLKTGSGSPALPTVPAVRSPEEAAPELCRAHEQPDPLQMPQT
jgi:hypothetical protein